MDAVPVDLLDAEATQAWARGIAERHGRVDALVHLVGGWWPSAPIEEASLEDWGRFHDLLITTYQHTTQAFVPHLLASGRGRVMIVSTSQAQAPNHKMLLRSGKSSCGSVDPRTRRPVSRNRFDREHHRRRIDRHRLYARREP